LLESDNIENAWRGKTAEHIVGQELLTIDPRPSYHRTFWVRGTNGSSSEVDFAIQHEDMIIPIEVKSGTNSHQRSLVQYMEATPHDIAIRVSSQPMELRESSTLSGKRFRFVNIPFYYVSQIHKIINNL